MNINHSQKRQNKPKIGIFLLFSLAVLSICFGFVSYNKKGKPVALLINSTYYENRISPLESIMSDMGIEFERYLTFKEEFPEQDSFSSLIVSGGNSMLNYFDDKGTVLKGAELINNTNKPVLGICLGNQIIGRIHGTNLTFFEQQGWAKINIIKDDKILENVPYTFNAWQNHLYSLAKVPEDFSILCTGTANSIQMIKHNDLPIYGVQFHPEFSDGKMENHARIILENFLKLSRKKNKWIL